MNTNQCPDALEEAEEDLREKLQETLLVQMNEPTVVHFQEEVYRLEIDKNKYLNRRQVCQTN